MNENEKEKIYQQSQVTTPLPNRGGAGRGAAFFKTLLKVFIFLGLIAYLIFAFFHLNRNEQGQECTGLEIVIEDTGNRGFLGENEVRELLIASKHYPENELLEDVNLAELESVLVASPYIDKALCFKTVESKVAMHITPRIPVLHVLNDAGDDFYIDNCGGIMPRGHHTINLIVMTGHIDRATAGKRYAPMGVLLSEDEFWNQQIQEIHVTPAGELELTPQIGDHIILLGDTSNLTDKLYRMRTFITEGLDQAGWNRYKAIDLRFKNQVIGVKRDRHPKRV